MSEAIHKQICETLHENVLLTVVCDTTGTVISLALLTAAATAAAAAATTGLECGTSELGSKSWNISCCHGTEFEEYIANNSILYT